MGGREGERERGIAFDVRVERGVCVCVCKRGSEAARATKVNPREDGSFATGECRPAYVRMRYV